MANHEKEEQTPVLLSTKTNPEENQGAHEDASAAAPPVEQDPFYAAFWQNLIETSALAPQGEEPAYWPVHVLYELDDLVTYRKSSNLTPRKAALADKLAPIQASIRNIKTAYPIIAYPHCKLRQQSISVQVSHDQRRLRLDGAARDHVELNDTEMNILRALCEGPRYTLAEGDERGRSYPRPVKIISPQIPFDPQRRTSRFSEVAPPKF